MPTGSHGDGREARRGGLETQIDQAKALSSVNRRPTHLISLCFRNGLHVLDICHGCTQVSVIEGLSCGDSKYLAGFQVPTTPLSMYQRAFPLRGWRQLSWIRYSYKERIQFPRRRHILAR